MILSVENRVDYTPYPSSINETEFGKVYMAEASGRDVIIACENAGFTGEPIMIDGSRAILAELTHTNACALRKLFPFTAPQPVLTRAKTMGVGDRLGIACTGHIKVFEEHEDVYPVLAQQSIRELKLTGRTYYDVLDAVTFSVFKHGFKRGFGADGDHLKTPEEIQYALSCGFSMITLDCSEHIRNDIDQLSDDQINHLYIPDTEMEKRYIGNYFDIGENNLLYYDAADFRRMYLIYSKAIDFMCDIYHRFIEEREGEVDLEISIDETSTPTTPLQHFFIANELKLRGIRFATIAPRFCGEFQKGIDYIGDIDQFERDFQMHAVIARHFGYKLSIHSGSDKFSLFPIIGRLTQGCFHLKTAGTNWLEAMCLVAKKAPALYREIHKYALEVFNEARKYYHVTTDLSRIPEIDLLSDDELPHLFKLNDARQLIHITYGLILQQKDPDGNYLFRDRLYCFWKEYAEDYAQMLHAHIGRHLKLLLNCIDLNGGFQDRTH